MPGPLLVRVAPGPPPSIDDLAWEERARALDLETLPNIRASAGKWAAGITSLTGIFTTIAVLKGPDEISKLPNLGKGVVIFLVTSAIGLATYGTFQALIAAQGGPEGVLPIGQEIRRLYRSDAKAAGHQLQRSRFAVIGAILALALALLTTWIWTPKSVPGKVMVVQASGVTSCGDLQAGDPGYVTVLPSATAAPTRVPLGDVKAVSPLDACP